MYVRTCVCKSECTDQHCLVDGLLQVHVPLARHVEGRKQIGNESHEDRAVIKHNLWQVEVAEGPHQHLRQKQHRHSIIQSMRYYIRKHKHKCT